MGKWVEGIWEWFFRWRRTLSIREENLLLEMSNLIGNVLLLERTPDSGLDNGVGRSVHGPINLKIITESSCWCCGSSIPLCLGTSCSFEYLCVLVENDVKLGIFKGQPAKEEGYHYAADDARCPICLQVEETLDHLLIACPIAAEVWMRCYC